MTHNADAVRRRGVAARWCALAERRLQHLTELFDSGRWRRYYSERAFLENVREATAVVAFWRELAGFEPVKNKGTIDIAARVQRRAALMRHHSATAERTLPPESPPSFGDPARAPALLTTQEPLSKPQSQPAKVRIEPVKDAAVLNRYPILRNAL